jgi:hypothetical protein
MSTYIISLVFSACGGVRSSFPSIRPVIHLSNFLIPEEEDDERGGRRKRQQQIKNFKLKKEEIKLLINK